ncbi:MAG: nucleotidyltransferase domain-containing protein [Armatimonadetes bacterium]|nr:nucleotidyltransferase domain-containing protein [Armatimonadota bacterium]
MSPIEISLKLGEVRDQLVHLGVSKLSIFGSAAKSALTEGSDLDFLVEFSSGPTFDQYMSLKELLERAFGTSIDLVTLGALRDELRKSILDTAVRVA